MSYRVIASAVVVCLILSACAGEGTSQSEEVASLVNQAATAIVAVVATPEPIVVEKVVKETVIVEKPKPVEVTVIVEKPVEVTVVREKAASTARGTGIEATPTPTAAGAAAGSYVSITGDVNVNLRGGPGTVYDVVGSAKLGSRYEVIGMSPGRKWCQVRVKGGAAWIACYLDAVTEHNTDSVAIVEPPPMPVVVSSADEPLDRATVNLASRLTDVCPTSFQVTRHPESQSFYSDTFPCDDAASIRVVWLKGPSRCTSTVSVLIELPPDSYCSLDPPEPVRVLSKYFREVPPPETFEPWSLNPESTIMSRAPVASESCTRGNQHFVSCRISGVKGVSKKFRF